jgi:hypothetical protein
VLHCAQEAGAATGSFASILLATARLTRMPANHCGPEEREGVDAVQPPQPGNRVGEEAQRHLDTGYRDAFPLERRVIPRNAKWTGADTAAA